MKLSAKDEAKLKGCHPDLVKIVRHAAEITTIPFVIMETKRSVEQQRKNIAKGVSQTMRSRHLPSKDGLARAADIVPVIDNGNGRFTVIWAWPTYYKLAPIIKQAANDAGIPVEWGGDWKSFKDGPHWQLPWAKYP